MRDIRVVTYTVLLLVCVIAVSITGCGRQNGTNSDKLLVAASIAPMYSFAKEVGGDFAQVELLVPSSANPHTYQLTPDQMELLSNASVLVLNGAGLEFWADKAIDAADNPKLEVVRTADGLKLIDTPDEHAGHDDHEGEGGNPHVWSDPVYAVHQVNTIRDAFIKADPEHAQQYRENAEAFSKKLKALDAEIKDEVVTYSSREYVAFHSAWIYFGQRYGLEQIAVIEESPGKEPSAQHIRELVDTVRKSDARVVIAEPQSPLKAANVVAEETGLKVIVLDPLGQPPGYDYIKTMQENLTKLSEAMK